jgi:lysophospholipase L1-like esterase
MKDICKKNNIDCLDLYTVLKKNWENLPYPKDDPVHPNAYGNLLISQEIIRHLYE